MLNLIKRSLSGESKESNLPEEKKKRMERQDAIDDASETTESDSSGDSTSDEMQTNTEEPEQGEIKEKSNSKAEKAEAMMPDDTPEWGKQLLKVIRNSKGPLQCQSILEKKTIQFIILFIDKNINKILNDLLLILQKKKIPIITLSDTEKFSEKFQNHLQHISIIQKEQKVLEELAITLQKSYQKQRTRNDFNINFLFKNFFKKKISVEQEFSKKISFPLSSSLIITEEEKNTLLKSTRKKNS